MKFLAVVNRKVWILIVKFLDIDGFKAEYF